MIYPDYSIITYYRMGVLHPNCKLNRILQRYQIKKNIYGMGTIVLKQVKQFQ